MGSVLDASSAFSLCCIAQKRKEGKREGGKKGGKEGKKEGGKEGRREGRKEGRKERRKEGRAFFPSVKQKGRAGEVRASQTSALLSPGPFTNLWDKQQFRP